MRPREGRGTGPRSVEERIRLGRRVIEARRGGTPLREVAAELGIGGPLLTKYAQEARDASARLEARVLLVTAGGELLHLAEEREGGGAPADETLCGRATYGAPDQARPWMVNDETLTWLQRRADCITCQGALARRLRVLRARGAEEGTR